VGAATAPTVPFAVVPIQIVLADDQPSMRDAVRAVLTAAGFAVVAEAPDAPALVDAALEHRPDLVVTDLNMPPGDLHEGVRAAREIRARQPATGVLVLSQFGDRRYAIEVLELDGDGGAGYVLKERVGDVAAFKAVLDAVADGGAAVDLGAVRHTGRKADVLAALRAPAAP
jgi:DNA-binding NarL/FixJ family response regulator